MKKLLEYIHFPEVIWSNVYAYLVSVFPQHPTESVSFCDVKLLDFLLSYHTIKNWRRRFENCYMSFWFWYFLWLWKISVPLKTSNTPQMIGWGCSSAFSLLHLFLLTPWLGSCQLLRDRADWKENQVCFSVSWFILGFCFVLFFAPILPVSLFIYSLVHSVQLISCKPVGKSCRKTRKSTIWIQANNETLSALAE